MSRPKNPAKFRRLLDINARLDSRSINDDDIIVCSFESAPKIPFSGLYSNTRVSPTIFSLPLNFSNPSDSIRRAARRLDLHSIFFGAQRVRISGLERRPRLFAKISVPFSFETRRLATYVASTNCSASRLIHLSASSFLSAPKYAVTCDRKAYYFKSLLSPRPC